MASCVSTSNSPLPRHLFTELTPNALLARLAALVPPPYVNMVRYRGVFASRHHLRSAIAYRHPRAELPVVQLPLFQRRGALELPARIPSAVPVDGVDTSRRLGSRSRSRA
jgi:hypothetical protein